MIVLHYNMTKCGHENEYQLHMLMRKRIIGLEN